jgi:hypothetical protein
MLAATLCGVAPMAISPMRKLATTSAYLAVCAVVPTTAIQNGAITELESAAGCLQGLCIVGITAAIAVMVHALIGWRR